MAKPAPNYDKASESLMQDRCVCVSVEFGRYGTSRKVDMSTVEVDADKSRMRATKYILDSDNMNAIHKVWNKAYNWLWTKCLPAPLRAGMYLIPNEMTDELRDKMREFEEEAKPFIEALIDELPDLKKADKLQLRAQYNELDYPEPDELRASFFIKVRFVEFRVPDRLSDKLRQEEIANQTKDWEQAMEAAAAFLRETGMFLIDQFANQLKIEKTKKGEKRGRIYDSTIDNLRNFLKDYAIRNVAGDTRMAALMIMAKKTIEGVDAETLRGDDAMRGRVSEEIEKIKADVAGLMKKPLRAIDLG